MAQQHINYGTTPNDGTGDTLRESQRKAEENFTELYAATGGTGVATVTGTLVNNTDPLNPVIDIPSWQDQYDADPNNTKLDDGAGTFLKANYEELQMVDPDNDLIIHANVIQSVSGDTSGFTIQNGSGVVSLDLQDSDTKRAILSGLNGLQLATGENLDGDSTVFKTQIKSDNITAQRVNQTPDSNGTFAISASNGGAPVFADTEGNIDLSTLVGGGAVDSVNGQTGVVVLDAADVGADPTGSAAAALASAQSYTNAKRTFSHRFQGSAQTWADGVTYYYAGTNNATPLLSSSRYVAAGITATAMDFSITGYFPGTLGSSENITVLIRNTTTGINYNLTTTYQATSVSSNLAGTISFACTQGDLLEIHVVVPTMATNPTGVLFSTEISIRN